MDQPGLSATRHQPGPQPLDVNPGCQGPKRQGRLLRHDRVAESPEPVGSVVHGRLHPTWNPIKVSTKRGESRSEVGSGGEDPGPLIPLLGAWRPSRQFVGVSRFGAPASLQSRAVGVPHRSTHVRRFNPPCAEWPAPDVSRAVAVGQAEEPGALVRGANFGRSDNTPLRIEPEAGKVGEDFAEPFVEVTPDVLNEDEGGGGLTNDPSNSGPKVSRVGSSELLACLAEWLAQLRVARSDEIHTSTPRATAETPKVIPYRCRIQGLFFHPRHEDARGKGFPLDVANSPCGGTGELDSEVEASDPTAEGEHVEGR